VCESDRVPTATEQQRDVAAAHNAVYRAQKIYGPQVHRPRRATAADRLREFVRRYGWRAYALPVLAVVTVVALLTTKEAPPGGQHPPVAAGRHGPTTTRPTATGPTTPPPARSHIALKSDAPGPRADNTVLKAAALPPGPAYSEQGTGTFRTLRGTSPVVGSGPLHRYSIDVENGVSGIDLKQFQQEVTSALADSRSWSGHGVSMKRVDSGKIDFHVTLVSAMTIRKLCGYTIHVETSCYVRAGSVSGVDVNRVAINDARWVRGATAYLGDLDAYRTYMINHEVGHALGHEHAHQCLPGGLAPAMMQQTFGLISAATGRRCTANPWPYPPGVSGAPGAEQPDTSANDEYGLGKLSGD
jgi:hypothetical protein